MPRDRDREFSTRLFGDYQRREDLLDEMIIQLYSRGVSTRAIADILEMMKERYPNSENPQLS